MILEKLMDRLFGRPILGSELREEEERTVTKEEFERRKREQDWRRKRLESEADLWANG